jgi:hypothetical protein
MFVCSRRDPGEVGVIAVRNNPFGNQQTGV